MDPVAKPPALSPALLAGRERGTAATSGARRRRTGFRQRRLARSKEVTWLLSPANKYTTTLWRKKENVLGLGAPKYARRDHGFGLTAAIGTCTQVGERVNQTTMRTMKTVLSFFLPQNTGTIEVALTKTSLSAAKLFVQVQKRKHKL